MGNLFSCFEMITIRTKASGVILAKYSKAYAIQHIVKCAIGER